MKPSIFLSFIIIFSFASCKSDKNTSTSDTVQKTTTAPKQKKQMSGNNQDNAMTQDQKDEKALTDYAASKKLDVQRTNSGLYYLIEEKGDGKVLKMGEAFKAHYSGYFLDGKEFDSSYKRGQPLASSVGGMIPGWNEALQFIPVGSKVKLLIPSKLAYGARGFPGFVPPNSPLIFDMHIMP